MNCADMHGGFGSTIEEIEHRKKRALEDIAEMNRDIERLRAEEEERYQVKLISLFNRMDSRIKTVGSSFSDEAIGEVIESPFGKLNCAESYMQTIDVEISGRYKDYSDDVYAVGKLSDLAVMGYGQDPTLVVSFLIPFDMIQDDKFFLPDS